MKPIIVEYDYDADEYGRVAAVYVQIGSIRTDESSGYLEEWLKPGSIIARRMRGEDLSDTELCILKIMTLILDDV